MDIIGARLKQLREENDLSQEDVAKAVDVSRSSVALWETGRSKPTRKLNELSSLYHVSIDYILGKTNIKQEVTTSISDEGVKIPILGSVVAGIPVSAITDILGYEEITQQMARSGQYFALRIKGDSMLPDLKEGDTVIVKEQPDVDSGDVAIVLINGDEATVKQVKKTDGGIVLFGYNTAVYEPHFYSNQDIEELPIRIIGKVVESRRKW